MLSKASMRPENIVQFCKRNKRWYYKRR